MRRSILSVLVVTVLLLAATRSDAASTCPTIVSFDPALGESVADTGWTGLAHNHPVFGNVFRLGIDCVAGTPPCGTCPLTGVLPNAEGMFQRCLNDTSLACTEATEVGDCGAVDTCAVFLTVPQQVNVGGISSCSTYELSSPVTGSVGVESGALDLTFSYRSRIFFGGGPACPACNGDSVLNDGIRNGTCASGPRVGLACDGNGPSPFPDFGTSSFDCPSPPGALLTTLDTGPVTMSTGTQSLTLTTANPCTGAPGAYCFCAGGPGAPTQPHSCIDDTTSPGSGCVDTGPLDDGKGTCADGPVDRLCSNHPNRGCVSDADCDDVEGACTDHLRACFTTNGIVGDVVAVSGVATPPVAEVSNPTAIGMLACAPPSESNAVNSAVGLPGLTRNLHVGRMAFGESTTPAPACPLAPDACRAPAVPGKSQLQLKDKSPDDKDLLKWRWAKGAATTLAELGDPTTTDHYDLCLYDGNGLRAAMVLPAGGLCGGGHPCWKALSKGFVYKNAIGSPHGITKVTLRSGAAGKSSMQVNGKGQLLSLPTLTTLQAPLTVQLRHRASGLCWGTAYPAPFKRLTATDLIATD